VSRLFAVSISAHHFHVRTNRDPACLIDQEQAQGRRVDFLDTLNAEQRRAVAFDITGSATAVTRPLLVIAGAGSGKTTTLASRVANLIVHGCSQDRILLLTFSRRAASEMTGRVRRILQSRAQAEAKVSAAKISWSGTFHAIGARLLRIYADRIGLSPGFSIHDREDAADLMNLVRHDLGLSEKSTRFPLKAACLSIYSLALNSRLPLGEVLDRHYPWCARFEDQLRELFAGYVAAKQEQDVLDYDDLLLYWAEMMQEPAIAADIGGRFDQVLVDEYQDTNPLQAGILLKLKPDGNGLTVVGDDAQAIYGFRAATIRNILNFPAQFSPPAEVVTLEQNYRSTATILSASNAVIGEARERYTKDLRSERASQQKPLLVTVSDDLQQSVFIATTVLENREQGIPLKSQAVLFRTSHHSSMLEVELARRNIPFVKFGGLRFLEAAHVKDLVSILRWAANPKDRVAAFRVLQMLPGVGPGTAAKAFDRILTDAFPFAALALFRPPAATREIWPSFVELISSLSEGRCGWPAELELARTWYEPIFERNYPDSSVRSGDLDQLTQIARQYSSRERFLTELPLDPPDASSDEAGTPLLDEDYLILSTIHSAKGQEWTSVFVLNVVDGCIPSDMATGNVDDIEEERRLLYVAMTRARDDLYLMVPQRFYIHHQRRSGDRHVYASRTRFISGPMLSQFQQTGWPARNTGDASTGDTTGVRAIDIRARVGNMWKV
jgi:DNA helicase-2/ATP-dependent DNA helicase PcrA